jgi:uncharacterized heparinase superfamily protein
MKPIQLAGIAERRLRHAVIPRLPVDFDARYETRVPSELAVSSDPLCENLARLRRSLSEAERRQYREAADEAAAGRYTFLHRTIDFGERIDWDHEAIDEQPLFWRLKLEAFEGFEWLALSGVPPSAVGDRRSRLERQVFRWAEANPIGEGPYLRRGWIPHSVSLRVLHWCRYVAWCAGDDEVTVPERLLRILYKNALFLENHVEHEVGGNHLLENAVALVAAGTLFRAHDTGWTNLGRRLFEAAAEEQFLADGCHFERSPMYHVTVLRRYATAYDLLSTIGRPVGDIEATAAAAMGFLERLLEPGGAIPLLNDSVCGETLRAETCLSYCRACGLAATDRTGDRTEGSGYRLLPTEAGTLLFDVGEVGPPHLPAHSHNDHLSVLLWLDGDPILADTGVYDYGANERRQYARSVAAHNTAQYDAAEPIPIGGSYLMGKRTSVSVVADEPGRITARYARRSLGGPAYEHRREVVTTGRGWEVSDALSGQSDASGDSGVTYTVRHHFHPTVNVSTSSDQDGGFDVESGGERVASILLDGADRCRLASSPYFPEYGRETRRAMIVATAATGSAVRTTITPGPFE